MAFTSFRFIVFLVLAAAAYFLILMSENSSSACTSALSSLMSTWSMSSRSKTSCGSQLSSKLRRISDGSVMPPRRRARSISSCTMGRNSHVICSVSSGSDLAVTATVMAFGS